MSGCDIDEDDGGGGGGGDGGGGDGGGDDVDCHLDHRAPSLSQHGLCCPYIFWFVLF